MKKFISVLAMICLLGGIATAQTTVKQKVAVYITGEAENSIKKVIGSKLVTGITRSEGFAAVERTADFLSALSSEQDYQMSGAVSDNQIARLGQQFGVRYVLVADLSEVFEQMFVSARMIDVQTAQITNSTEESAVVDNMESLSKLAESIVLKLFYVTNFSKDDIKILGPFSDAKSLYNAIIPDGYHIASKEEIEKIIKNNEILKRSTKFPIYTDIKKDSSTKTQFFTVKYYVNNNTSTVKDRDSESRPYVQFDISYTFIAGANSSTSLSTFFIMDPMFAGDYELWNSPATSSKWKRVSEGLYDKTYNATIPSGYIYAIKNKKTK